MCAVEDCEPWDVFRKERRAARKAWHCHECHRAIAPGESYYFLTGLIDGHWYTHRCCLHCEAAGEWMRVVCGGYPIGMLCEELEEHYADGYRSVGLALLIDGIRLQWGGGADPVPTGVAGLAEAALCAAVGR